jgi:pimeloyl-ACP methyl ester carboxylesterase
MILNQVASGTEPLDMTGLEEFESLLTSAADLGIAHSRSVRYTSRHAVVRGHRFHLLDWGPIDAPPVLLLHGGHQSAHSWDLVSLHLADRYRVIAPDQRGHGDSEWARSAEYSNHEMARDAEALTAELGLERPIVVGHSMGGRNALLLTLAAPGLARGLVVVDVGPEVAEAGRRAIMSFVSANEEFDDLEQFFENVRRYDPYRSPEHIRRTVRYNLFQRADGKYVSKCDRAPRRLGLHARPGGPEILTLDDVRTLDLPTLVVRGATSNVLDPDAAERFVAALPDGRLVTVSECGHNVHSQNTAGFLAVLDPFLAELGVG